VVVVEAAAEVFSVPGLRCVVAEAVVVAAEAFFGASPQMMANNMSAPMGAPMQQ